MSPEYEQAERDRIAQTLDVLLAIAAAFDSDSPLLKAMPLPTGHYDRKERA